jgi:rubrerythrin
MSYIKREDAINAAIDAVDDWDGGYVRSRAEMIEKKFKALPAADVVERKVGKWTNKRTLQHDGEWYCSRCQFEPYYSRDIHTLNFCPNCGADMREE